MFLFHSVALSRETAAVRSDMVSVSGLPSGVMRNPSASRLS